MTIRYIDMAQLNQRFHNALPLTGLGASGLGAVPRNVSLVMGITSSDWDQIPPDQQQQLKVQADNAVYQVRDATSQLAQYAIMQANISMAAGDEAIGTA